MKHINDEGIEFWYARELQSVLEYTRWRNFESVIDKAKIACISSGNDVDDHFADLSKTIPMPKTAEKSIPDFQLSRYACYLIIQNGDPRKEVIALGQRRAHSTENHLLRVSSGRPACRKVVGIVCIKSSEERSAGE